MGKIVTHELVPGGKAIAVTNDNKYVCLYVFVSVSVSVSLSVSVSVSVSVLLSVSLSGASRQ